MLQSDLKGALLAAMAIALFSSCTAETGSASQEQETAQNPVASPALQKEEVTAEHVLEKLRSSLVRAKSTRGTGAPALWTLKDDDTVIHLYGTVHILRPDTEWRTPDFEAAFAAADMLVLEADTNSPEARQAMQTLIPKYGLFDEGQTLNGVIDDADEQTVETALNAFGFPMAALQPMKPWLVSLQISVAQMVKSGYDPESGVEPILTREARVAGKRLGYLETAEDQFSILAGADMEQQVKGLLFTAQTLEFGPELLDALVTEWADGDVAGLGEILSEPDAIGGKKAYEDLLVNRNRNWVPQITAMLETPGTIFVAVGSGHLAGPDSVINMLRAKGLEVSGPQ